jgi:hypothetical protein
VHALRIGFFASARHSIEKDFMHSNVMQFSFNFLMVRPLRAVDNKPQQFSSNGDIHDAVIRKK